MQFAYFIGYFHYLGRLDECRLAGRGLVIDKALYLSLVGGIDRDEHLAVSHHD